MNAQEVVTRLLKAKLGEAIGAQFSDVVNRTLPEANPNALAYILEELEKFQGVNWQEVAELIDMSVGDLRDNGIEPRW